MSSLLQGGVTPQHSRSLPEPSFTNAIHPALPPCRVSIPFAVPFGISVQQGTSDPTPATSPNGDEEWAFWTDTWKAVKGHAEQTQVRLLETHPPGENFLAALQRNRPGLLSPYSSVHVFLNGVHPSYEDPVNRGGGHFKLSHSTEESVEEVWVRVAQAVVQGQFPGAAGGVVGATVFRKHHSSFSMKVWVRYSADKTLDKAHLSVVRQFLGKLLDRSWYSSVRFRSHRFILQQLGMQRNRSCAFGLSGYISGAAVLPASVDEVVRPHAPV